MDIDKSEDRYLLAGSHDGNISLYDLHSPSKYSALEQEALEALGHFRSCRKPIRPRHTSSRVVGGNALGHTASISGIQWYAVDNGIFVSSGLDGRILVWDAQAFEVAFAFNQQARIQSISMHPQRALCAAATMNTVLLCDIATGASTHTLVGHGGTVSALHWCPSIEFELTTASHDGTLRLWDIRKSGSHACVATLHCRTPPPTSSVQAPNAYAHLQRVTGYGAAMAHLQYTQDGQSLVSLDIHGDLVYWDRTAATQFKPRPASFLGEGKTLQSNPTRTLLVTPSNRIWMSSATSNNLLGYDLVQTGGRPRRILQGHLAPISSLAWRSSTHTLWSASQDGMILAWGYQRPHAPSKPLPTLFSTKPMFHTLTTDQDWWDL